MITINFYNDYQTIYDNYESIFYELARITIDKLKKQKEYEISVTLVNNDTIHKMNNEYRHKDYATDVISFESGLDVELIPVVDLGDIFISVDKALEQSKEYQHSIERELMFLFVHGLLHCLGYDHHSEIEEKIMFNLQEEILDEYKKEL